MLESGDSVTPSPGEEGRTASVVSPGLTGLEGFVPSVAAVSPGLVPSAAVVSPGFVGFVPSAAVVSPGFVGLVPSAAVVSPGFVGFTGFPFSSVSSIDMPSDEDSRSSVSSDSFVAFSVSFVSFGTYPSLVGT